MVQNCLDWGKTIFDTDSVELKFVGQKFKKYMHLNNKLARKAFEILNYAVIMFFNCILKSNFTQTDEFSTKTLVNRNIFLTSNYMY